MTKPDHARAAAVGTRASDYATSKYYLPPEPPPDAFADDAVEPVQHEEPPIWQASADPVVHPVASPPAAPVAPLMPISPARPARRAVSPLVVVALVLALLAGVLGGGYWFLNRNDDATTNASPAGHSLSASVQPKVAAKKSTPATTAKPAKASTTAKTSSGYFLRLPKRHFSYRIPHRPEFATLDLKSAGLSASALLMADRTDKALVEWVRTDSAIPASAQSVYMNALVGGLGKSGSFTVTSARSTTFHGRPARSVSLTAQTGASFSGLVVVYAPTHTLVVLAPTGPVFNLIKNTFTWPI